ncbi:peptidoglycan-binding protein [Amylibacter sp.]|nr:peptidoglycan-binding protein [Amylibacter sp.]
MNKLLSIITILSLLMPHASYAKVDKDVNVAKVQAMLAELCYKPGIVDGAWGKKTETAVKAFFAKHYRKYDGNFDVSDANFILSAGASAKVFGSENVKKCLVVYSDRIGDELKNTKIKKIIQNVSNKVEARKNIKLVALNDKQKSILRCGAKMDDLIHLENLKIYDGCSLPENLKQKTNEQTLHLYLRLYMSWERFGRNHFESKAAQKPREFIKELREFPYLTKQLETTGLISYLYASNGKLIVDQKTPPERFGGEVKDDAKLWGASIAKSMTSYLMGHAICQGYIEGVEHQLTDWPLLQGTLYENVRIIDLLNMRAGDQNHADKNGLKASGNHINNKALGHIIRDELQNTKPASANYNYSELPPLLLLNYIMHRTGKDFQSLLDYSFGNVAKTKQSVFFQRLRWFDQALPIFYATRHDYLRIAQSMLDGWNNNNCYGKYLKTLFQNAESKRQPHRQVKPFDYSTKLFRSYGGFFHTEYQHLSKRNILQMHGYGGQHIWIDFDNSRIIATNAINEDYNWKHLIADVIKSGKVR